MSRLSFQIDTHNLQTILITGTSSGLGLAFLEHYASLRPPRYIIALDQTPFPEDRRHLLGERSYVRFIEIDVTSEEFIGILAATMGPIHLLIHCAGVRGLVPSVVSQRRQRDDQKRTDADVAAAESLDVMDQETMMRTLEVNTWGAFNLVRCFVSKLQLAVEETTTVPAEVITPPRAIILSSRMGSVASNTTGGAYAYRASKAALNAVVKSFSVDVPEVIFSLLHPGRVETGLVEWKEEGAISVEESLRDCLKTIEGLEMEDSGKLIDRFGVKISW